VNKAHTPEEGREPKHCFPTGTKEEAPEGEELCFGFAAASSQFV